ncbi:hypothetical protein PUR29_14135 [Methylobacterium ajmalii]|uniref:Uncharacterized protein n=1 Tax=Methylobacterium ajmalii TaxID=2738439 RepID=A0ABU9ZT61_9HYPH
MARAPFGFAPWPVVPAAPDDESTPFGLAPGQMPVDPRRDGSVQPTAAGRDLSRAVGAAAGGMAQGLLNAAKLPGDVYAGQIDPMSDEGIRRAGDLAGFAMTGGIGGAAKQSGEAVLGSGPIRVYHGSPHDFDRFSLAHIGTGEGNQGFGRGLYFAGDERIAKSYRDDLSKVPVLKFDGDASGLNIASPQNARDLAAFGFDTGGGQLDAGLGNIRMMAEFDPRLAPFAEEAARHLRDGRVALGPKSPGHMYEVGIDADPARLLDWDAPLSGQSPAVRSFAADRLADPQARAAIQTTARQRLGGPADMTGQDLYRGLTGYDDGAKAAVSADMRAAGIPGVQYMDTGSRGFGGGAQTRQYVTFGDDIVSILRKYGVAGSAGAGGAAAALAPGDTQAAPSPSGAPMAFGFGSLSGLPADVLMRQRQGMPEALGLGDPAAMMLGPDQAPARPPAAAQPQQDQPVVAPFGFGALAPRVPVAGGAGMGFGLGSAGAGPPLPPQEPVATGAAAPAVRPQARAAAPAQAPAGTMASAPLPPARPPEFGTSAAPAAPLDIKPPAQAAAPSAAEPSALDKVSGWLGNNSDMLIGIGTGLMSTPGIGRGLAAGVQQGVAMQNASAAQGLARAKQAVEVQKLAREQGGVTANAGLLKRAYPGVTDEQATALAATPSNVQEALKILRDPNHGTSVPSGFRMRADGQGYEPIAGGPQDPATKEAGAAAQARGAAAGKPEADEAGKLKAAMEARRAAAPGLGLVEGSPAWQSFVGTGKIGRDQDLSATDKQAIQEADDNVMAAQGAINSMRQARELSKKAYDGPTAGIRGTVTSLFGSEAGEATKALDNVVTTNSLSQLKAIFGGNPTEGERKILLDVQGAANQPQAVRDGIFERAAAMAQRRLEYNQRRADDLRGGTYYKKGAGASVAPQGEMPAPATEPGGSQVSAPDPLAAARAAISQGADRKAVIQRLLQNKIDPRGL